MKSIEIMLSYECNNRCVYCIIPGHGRGVSMGDADVVGHMRRARGEGAEGVAFSGGEPSIVKRVAGYARAAAELGFKEIKIRSNGMMFAYEGFAGKLAEAGINRWSVSVKSHVAALHDELSARPGGFELLLRGLEALSDIGAAVECDFLTHARNAGDLLEGVRYFHGRGARGFTFQLISGYFAPDGRLRELLVPLDEAGPAVGDACEWLEAREGSWGITYDFPPCSLGGRERFFRDLRELGLVIADPGGHVFDVKDSPLAGKSRAAVCEGCEYATICAGFREDYLETFGAPRVRGKGAL